MSLLIPGGRPVAPNGPVPVDFAFLVGIEQDGNVSVITVDSQDDVYYTRDSQPDDIYGAISILINEDGVSGMQVLYDVSPESYDSAFLVMRMASGKILLAPKANVKVNPVRQPSREHILSSLAVLQGNILGMKAADMVLAVLQGQAQMEQNIAIAKAAGVG